MKCASRISVFLATFVLCGAFAAPLGAQVTLLVPQQYGTIQAAIDAASPGDTVLVDDGTYMAIDFLGKEITVTSVNGAGSTTIDAGLSGSVVKFEGCGSGSTLNGFTITRGTGTFFDFNFRGGGIFCESSSPVISNNVIVDNSVSPGGWGGGLYCHSSAPTFVNNVVQGNESQGGGGCTIHDSDGLFAGNDFVQNDANGWGGALNCFFSSPSIEGNSFVGNSADVGGAIVLLTSDAVISLNIFTDNSAAYVGGAIQSGDSSSPNIHGNTFEGNSAEGCGAINMYGGAGTVTDNEFTGNMALTYGGGALTCQALSVAIVEGNTFTNNVAAGVGGAIACWDGGSPTLRGNTIVGNSAYSGGGIGVYFSPGASGPTIIENYVESNSADLGGGIYSETGTDIIGNCILQNTAVGTGTGGGLYLQSSSGNVSGNTISSNTANTGAGAILQYCSVDLTNNTVYDNIAAVSASGLEILYDNGSTVTNTIVWGNTDPEDAQVVLTVSDPEITYSCIEGGWAGVGNIDSDPLLFDAGDGHLHLGDGSPCIDAGHNGAPGLPATDCDGEDRIVCLVVDIGADEAPAPPGGCGVPFVRGDVNQDGLFDIADAISSLGALFVTGSPTPDCMDAADANDDGSFDIGDPISVLSTLFVVGSPPLPAPHPDCGTDPTPDGLGCAAFDLTACP